MTASENNDRARADTWTAPDVTVDDLRAYARTGRCLGFTWPTRLLFRLCAAVLDRYDRNHRT